MLVPVSSKWLACHTLFYIYTTPPPLTHLRAAEHGAKRADHGQQLPSAGVVQQPLLHERRRAALVWWAWLPPAP